MEKRSLPREFFFQESPFINQTSTNPTAPPSTGGVDSSRSMKRMNRRIYNTTIRLKSNDINCTSFPLWQGCIFLLYSMSIASPYRHRHRHHPDLTDDLLFSDALAAGSMMHTSLPVQYASQCDKETSQKRCNFSPSISAALYPGRQQYINGMCVHCSPSSRRPVDRNWENWEN